VPAGAGRSGRDILASSADLLRVGAKCTRGSRSRCDVTAAALPRRAGQRGEEHDSALDRLHAGEPD